MTHLNKPLLLVCSPAHLIRARLVDAKPNYLAYACIARHEWELCHE